ncbi:MAG: sulfatase, partial [Planctomycetes bacterium]|nr:sulfatase [Planctomycetota bacterium]
ARQDWNASDSTWLKWQFWAQQFPWKWGLAAAAAVFCLALVGARFALIAWNLNFFGSWRGIALCIVLLAIPQGWAAALRPSAPPDAPNVLFVLVDTVRADRTSFLGYERETWPGVGKLAEEGVVFERAMTQAPWTKPTVATLFSGLVPSKHGAMSHMPMNSGRRFVAMGSEHRVLPESYSLAGYDTAAVVHNANIQPIYGFGQGFEDFMYVDEWDLRAPVMIDAARDWLSDRSGDRPWFLYLHLTDPHYPYDPPAPPEGPRGTWDKSGSDFVLNYHVVKSFHDGEREPTEEMRQHLSDAYDEELLYTDQQLTPFLHEVRKQYPDTVIVFVGDHGDELWEHGSVGHGHVVYDELVHVPMVLWGPNLPAARIPGQVRLLDVGATILDATGIVDPHAQKTTMGTSLIPMIMDENRHGEHLPAPFETGGDGEPPWQLRGISAVHGGQLWKLIRQEIDFLHEAPSIMLFNISEDPLEKNDVAGQFPEVAEALFALMKERDWYIKPEDLEGELFDSGAIGEEDRHLLEEMGYGEFDD